MGLTVGELLVFSGLIQQLTGPVSNIANIANSIQQSLIAAHRVYEVLSAPVEIQSSPGAAAPAAFRGRVEFDNLTFGYAPTTPILQELSFTIEPGECVAILGATGSGKSTLLSLIPRFYDPNNGALRLDGEDLRQLDVQTLRRAVGVVFQESFLFSTSVRSNIAFGNPDASDAEIATASRIAAVDTFVDQLPDGYETILHEGGVNLSGGQRQRIAIARAILQNPAVLLLDDPTAAIDAHTEHEILSSIESAMKGRTTLIVTHRLSTLRRAHRIIVLEHGRVAEIGTHDQLFANRGLYHTIVSHQTGQT
jgi:ATP-binding cassette subfamily B protein